MASHLTHLGMSTWNSMQPLTVHPNPLIRQIPLITCHLLYNIDETNESATQTSSLKTDNTWATIRGK